MIKLTNQMIKDNPGIKPWCAGIGSDAATGWPVTDWLEDVVLNKYGTEVYDQWITHKIPFNDPRIQAALAQVGTILKNPAYVNGGLGDVKSIASTTFNDGGIPITKGQCFLHRQASFYQANWPTGTKVAPDGDVFAFPFPTIGGTPSNAVVGGGEFVAAFNTNPATQALQYFLSTSEWANLKAKASNPGWFNANKGLDVNNLKSPIDQLAAKELQDPNVAFKFDASDLMPAAVGSGAEWKQLTNWIANDQSDKVTVDNIEAAWPK
jgi:alpha-glucoside transport system substrate-binding protein